ncbi:hypothetical protein [Flavobacterium sp. NRK F7]|uniref:hypothetical protein n=1 Tax=Flavobacterium sp. NRK F7 TaxID=2954930 RepID=UPI0020902A3D|nr:hypothetical protein [Flavobacterium sp. NRK F7]MCO6164115.1 hypothetical protein [Flavobacterium sp. NRK F7]
MNKLLLFILVFFSAFVLGQNESVLKNKIDSIAYNADKSNLKVIKELTLKMDSIQVKVKRFKNKIETENTFLKSKSFVTINFYFKDEKLILVRAEEKSPLVEDLSNFTAFYYDEKDVFYKNYYQKVRICLPIDFDKSIYEVYGYNKNLNESFFTLYFEALYTKISKKSL